MKNEPKPLYRISIDITRYRVVGYGHTFGPLPSHWGVATSVADDTGQYLEAFVLGIRELTQPCIIPVIPIGFHRINERHSKMPPRDCVLFADPREYQDDLRALQREHDHLIKFLKIHYDVASGGNELAAQEVLKNLVRISLNP